jgi:hypothetical protein
MKRVVGIAFLILSSLFAVLVGPHLHYIQNFGSLLEIWKESGIKNDEGFLPVLLKSFKGTHSTLYRPLSVFLYSLLFRNNNTYLHTLLWFFILFSIYTLSSFLFLRKITGDEKISFLSTILFIFIPPSLYLAWKTYDTNLIGLPLSFISCYLFFLAERSILFGISCLILSFLSILAGEASRVAVFLLLFLSFLFYKRKLENFFILLFTGIFLFIFLFFIAPHHTGSVPKKFLINWKDYFYYPSFILSHYIYALDISCIIFIVGCALSKLTNKKSLLYISLFPAVIFFPSYPFRNFEQGFIFLTRNPCGLLFIFLIFSISLLIIFFKEKTQWKKFSSAFILLFSISFIIGVIFYPNVRMDTSARSLLYTCPFLIALFLDEVFRIYKEKRYLLIFLYLLPFLFHKPLSFMNLKSEETAIRNGMNETISTIEKLERIERRKWLLIQIFVDYEMRDVFFAPQKYRKMEMETIVPSFFNINDFDEGMKKAIEKRCGYGVYVLFKGFRSEGLPYILEDEERILMSKTKWRWYLDLIQRKMLYPPPFERYLDSKYPVFIEKRWQYKIYPLSLSDFFQKLLFRFPLKRNAYFFMKIYRIY